MSTFFIKYTNNNFQFNPNQDNEDKLLRLAKIKNWSKDVYNRKYKELQGYEAFQKSKVRKYFNKYETNKYGFYYDEISSVNSNFIKLSYHLKWSQSQYEQENQYYMDLVLKDAQSRFNDIRSLQDIIVCYELRHESDLPNTKKKCKEILEHELFANIFDFIEGKIKNFKNIKDLS